MSGLGRLLGFVPLGIGIALNLVADWSFKHHQTTVKPYAPSSVLITNGVFRWSRNPMYFGMVLMLLGITILLGSASPYVLVFLFMVLMEVAFIRPEEAKMEKEFGIAFQH